ncbi:protein kinase [Nocardia thailandica]|uniref:Protein kinase n=1 Tax=Nocardia thailandica TaxID=257275 RepID=A0ABW6PGM6_9NOCA
MIEPLSAHEPKSLGRYRLLGVLGVGGMGRVLLATGPDGRFVAIKQIHATLVDDPEFRARFEREIRVSMRVSGAFTAAVIDYEVSSPAPWLASVFIPGVPLDQAVQTHGPLPVPALRTLAAGLAAALHSIHGTGLVHRDLKPANVILAADGPRVIDFGIAQPDEPQGAVTQTGALIGSPAYMSPEQATAQQLTPASDIFAFGSLLYMAAVGQSPFAAATAPATLFTIVHREPDYDRVPAEVRELVAGCLRKEPSARPTPAQILDHLGVQPVRARPWPAPVHERIADQSRYLSLLASDPDATQIIGPETPVPTTQEPVAVAPRRRGRRAIVAAAAVVGVVLVAGLAAVTSRGGGSGSVAAAGPVAPTATLPALASLRPVDTCRWLRQALGAEFPADVATGLGRSVESWAWQPTAEWGCAGSGGGPALRVDVGTALAGFAPAGRLVRGYELLRRGTGCAVATADAEHRWGVVVDPGRDRCDLAEYILDRLLATDLTAVPTAADAARSLVSVDPCALLDGTAPATGPGRVVSARSCAWPGDRPVTVSLSLDSRPASSVTRTMRGTEQTSAAGCTARYVFRDIGERYEEVVRISLGGGAAGTVCGEAEAMIDAVIPRLPTA